MVTSIKDMDIQEELVRCFSEMMHPPPQDARTPREIQLEAEVARLRARIKELEAGTQ